MSVVVVGAGVAGVAAAWSARRAGAEVTLIDGGPGASSFTSGAVDDAPWDELARASTALGAPPPATPLGEAAAAFARELELFDVGERRALLASTGGRLRDARGHDHALLDLGTLARGVVALPRIARAGWDADALAAAFADDARARERGLRFLAVDADVLRFDAEDRAPDADLASLHDDPERRAWLAARLAAAVGSLDVGAVLLGPWLGIDPGCAAALTARLHLPVGEALAIGSGTAGLRFERARDRLLARLGVSPLFDRVASVTPRHGEAGLDVELERAARTLHASAVVLAIGGVAGGGVVYHPPESAIAGDFPPAGGSAFRLSLGADVLLGAPREGASGVRGDAARALGVTSSMHGPTLDLDAWPRGDERGVLERVGVLADRSGRAARGLFVAGDAWAGRPRTVLEAVRAGVLVGAAAAASAQGG
ncbi:MAG TPA: FAD-dependent oxidoreductase [Byssovorax sp.]